MCDIGVYVVWGSDQILFQFYLDSFCWLKDNIKTGPFFFVTILGRRGGDGRSYTILVVANNFMDVDVGIVVDKGGWCA